MKLDDVVREIGEWGDKTFCPNGEYRGHSIVAHLKKEVKELRADPKCMEEIADCFMLLAHLAHQNKESLTIAVMRKFEINKKRKWGEPDEQGVVEHIPEAE